MSRLPPVKRIDLDPNPPKYTTPVPRMLPRDPRLPSDVNDLMRPDVEAHDTVPATAESGEYEVSDDSFDEKTPAEGPFAMRTVMKEELREFKESFAEGFAEMKAHCRDAANNSLSTLESVASLTKQYSALEKRVTAIELADRWVPRIAWLVTTAIAVIALLRTFKS